MVVIELESEMDRATQKQQQAQDEDYSVAPATLDTGPEDVQGKEEYNDVDSCLGQCSALGSPTRRSDSP